MVASAETTRTAILGMGRPTRQKTDPRPGSLPEAFALRLEHHVISEAASEAEKAGMGDHPVGRPHAPSPHGPAALEELVGLEHPEALQLTQAVEEALHLAHVRAVREHDAAWPQRRLDRRSRLPGFGQIEQSAVHVALL